ncbi:hypothetical protein ABH994_001661 [Bradyrhizobium yuanmingense]|uniref:hypothetical protein n=1 Tax=Bradyrhizobium yuanmingense TaxID=108015 RepID=UPI003516BB60
MTVFAIYEPTGQITQANKVYDPFGYDELLDDQGHAYLALQSNTLPSFDHWYVDVGAKELATRPAMPVEISKSAVKAGADDTALITGIPNNAKVTIVAAGAVLHSLDPIDASELEIAIPVPCVYSITISLWPYKDCKLTVEAF